MAEGPVDPVAAKQEVEARLALVRAEVELAKAQAELTTVSTAPDQSVAAAQREQARIDAAKALLDARSGLSTSTAAADLAAAKARFGTIEAASNAPTGAVTVTNGAGKGEAILLAARATRIASEMVAKDVGAAVKDKAVVIVPGVESPQFGYYLQFAARAALLTRLVGDATSAVSDARVQGRELQPEGVTGGKVANESAFAVAGAALETLNRLGSYFRSEYSVFSIDVAGDTPQLMNAMAGTLLRNVDWRPSKVIITGLALPKVDDAVALTQKLDEAAARLKTGVANTRTDLSGAKAAAEKEKVPEKKAKYEKATAIYEAALATASLTLAKVDELILSLTAADASGVLPLSRILRDKLAYDAAHSDGAMVLFIDVRSTSAGAYTKKNLWTFFGGMPFHVMGGVTVAYALVDPKRGVLASGIAPVHGGYKRVNDVEGALLRN